MTQEILEPKLRSLIEWVEELHQVVDPWDYDQQASLQDLDKKFLKFLKVLNSHRNDEGKLSSFDNFLLSVNYHFLRLVINHIGRNHPDFPKIK